MRVSVGVSNDLNHFRVHNLRVIFPHSSNRGNDRSARPKDKPQPNAGFASVADLNASIRIRSHRAILAMKRQKGQQEFNNRKIRCYSFTEERSGASVLEKHS